MSNIDHDNNTQQNIVNNFNNFQSQLIKDTGKYPLVAEVYCNSINSLVTGQALVQNGVALNIVDLRGNMKTIYRPSSTTVGNLRQELDGNPHIFIGGVEHPDYTALNSVVNDKTLRVLVDGRPSRNDVESGAAPIGQCEIMDIQRSSVSFSFNNLPNYKGLLTQNGREEEFIYIHYKVLQKAIFGQVHLFIRVHLGQDGKYHVLNDGANSKVAVKQIRKDNIQRQINAGRELSEDPLKEVAIMLSLKQGDVQHRNVMNVIEVGQDARCIYIVMPFADGGEMFDTVNRGGAQNEGTTRFYIRKMVSGLIHLHESGVSLNDTSLENTMMHSFGEQIEPILMDFGMASFLLANDYGARLLNKANQQGKIAYIAPEVYKRVQYDGVYADIWSLGVITIMLATGCPPVEKPSRTECVRFRLIQEGNLSNMLDIWHRDYGVPSLTPYFHDFVFRILIADKAWQRLPLSLMLEHPFVTGQILNNDVWGRYKTMMDMFQKLLDYAYKINNNIGFSVTQQEDVVNIASAFRLEARAYAGSGGDVDNLLDWCNSKMKCFFPPNFELSVQQ